MNGGQLTQGYRRLGNLNFQTLQLISTVAAKFEQPHIFQFVTSLNEAQRSDVRAVALKSVQRIAKRRVILLRNSAAESR